MKTFSEEAGAIVESARLATTLAASASTADDAAVEAAMSRIAGLVATIRHRYADFRNEVADLTAVELADAEGENGPLMAADDALVLVTVLAEQMRTRSGARQIADNARRLAEAVAILDRAAFFRSDDNPNGPTRIPPAEPEEERTRQKLKP